MNRIVTQWFLVLSLLMLGWIANAVGAAFDWVQQNLLMIIFLISALIAIFLMMLFLPVRHRNKEFLVKEDVQENHSEKVAEIQKAIRETPRLSRYAWSDNAPELLRQWKIYEGTGATPVRRKTAARRKRDQERKLMLQPSATDLSKIVWNGKMSCNKCQYLWQSRKASPPARCPKCNSSNLIALRERVPT